MVERQVSEPVEGVGEIEDGVFSRHVEDLVLKVERMQLLRS